LLFSFFVGRYAITPVQLIRIIMAKIFHLNYVYPEILDTVIFNVRFPRIIAAMVVGASLATAGATYQGMFRNPLVSPDILGASAGAGLGAAVGIYFSFSIIGIQLMSFAFSLIAVLSTYMISTKIKHDPMLSLVLSGVMIGSLFSSALGFIKYIADPYDKLPSITVWLMGSLSAVSPRDVWMALMPILIGAIPLYCVRWRLNVLSLGEEEAKALGLNTGKLRFLAIICSTLMTAAAISISGIIGWVGLIVPHLARMLVGPNYKILLPTSILIGGTYLLLVDDLARILTTVEIPLGILTSLIGIPFFLYLFLHSRWGWQ
jgi:iron complex transport system permease protein